MQKYKVLITGAAGYIGSLLLPALKERYELTLIDVKNKDAQGNETTDIKIADLSDSDYKRFTHLFEGMDAVVHLGYYRHPGKEGDNFRKRTYHDERVNVDISYNVYQLSVDAGIRRVVVASSNHAADWYEPIIHQGLMDRVSADIPPLTDNFYGWAKVAYEQLGFIFATGHFGRKLEIVQIRIGAPREIDYQDFVDNPQGYKRDLGAYISQRDLQQLFIKSIETENIEDEFGIPFQIFYGISDNTRKFWSITNARKMIGYAPEDDSEEKFAQDIATFLHGIKADECNHQD